jgi:hypothetical protein
MRIIMIHYEFDHFNNLSYTLCQDFNSITS